MKQAAPCGSATFAPEMDTTKGITLNLHEQAYAHEDFCLFEPGTNSALIRGLYSFPFGRLAGWGSLECWEVSGTDWAASLDDFLSRHRSHWIMGHISYEARLLAEPTLNSVHKNGMGFGKLSFFVPEYVYVQTPDEPAVLLRQSDMQQSPAQHIEPILREESACGHLHDIRTDFSAFYRERFARIREHLLKGDIYELNFCLPYSARGRLSDPAALWQRLCASNPNPFRALYRRGPSWLLCNSPERFLRREKNRLLSQPIKGTMPRFDDPEADRKALEALRQSEKERAENVMIADLVRNDLGRIARAGTVRADELFGLYSFPSVHQMISSLSAEMRPGLGFSDIFKAMFPMGSMTGAPKFSAMQLIDELEGFNRGLFSGSVGYIAPGGDFDFNVVIRSILYDENSEEIMFPAGSAVTVYAEADAEYAECTLKASRMLEALTGRRTP